MQILGDKLSWDIPDMHCFNQLHSVVIQKFSMSAICSANSSGTPRHQFTTKAKVGSVLDRSFGDGVDH